MFYPVISQKSTQRAVIDTFLGYNHNMRIADGELFDTKNLTNQYFPLLASRKRRGVLRNSFTKLQAVIGKDALYWVDNGTLYANGYATGLTGLQTTEETQLVSMGAYICVFPDKKYINTKTLTDFGSMGASWTYTGTAVYSMCHSDGTIYSDVTKSATEPQLPDNGAIWIDTSSGTVKEYSQYTRLWTVIETVYTRIDFTTMGQAPALFKEYDGIEVTGMHFDDLNGSKIVYAVGGSQSSPDYVVLIGVQEEAYTENNANISLTRSIPDMDFVCEAQNRLWGCRYGNDGSKNINEIYASALGDFRNWNQFLGLSTDSWRGSRGSDGPFTGCINYLGVPTFFKENVIHPISVSSVGAHQINDIPARGVQQGSHKSLVVVNETLYYKARTGVVAYQGGMPADVSAALGEERYYNAVAGAFGQRYYISMKDGNNAWHFFCYDVKNGLWMHEDNLHAECFACSADELYVQSSNHLIAINGTTGDLESPPAWYAETGIMYYEQNTKGKGAQMVRYASRYTVRLHMDATAIAALFVEYDSSGVWDYAGTIRVRNTGTVNIPVRPRRCDHLRLRIEGSGDVRIYSIARILEKGSDA